MQKILFKITFIILANLLAFLGLGLILDALFETNGIALLACVVVSIPVLGVVMYFKSKSIIEEIKNIDLK